VNLFSWFAFVFIRLKGHWTVLPAAV
jgi:hypothetical protein